MNNVLKHGGYAELRCKTTFSFLRGASQPEELVARAREIGLAGLAITDIASVAGVVRAHVAAREANLQLRIGAEITPRDAPPLILLSKSRAGYANLCRLLTTGRRRAPKGEYSLSLEDVLAHAEGLLAIVAPDLQHIKKDLFSSSIEPLQAAFGDNLYFNLEFHLLPGDLPLCKAVDEASRKYQVSTVVTNNAHYHDRTRKQLHDVFVAIREKATVAEAGYHLFQNSEYGLRSPDEQKQHFNRILGTRGETAVARTVEAASRCQFSLDELRYEYPDEVVPEGESPKTYLRRITYDGAATHYPQGIPEKIVQTIEHELSLIADLHFESYFLTVYDIVKYARSRGILCQGRGSAANSAVCYCIGVTSVDPLHTELLFERFLSKERNEPPDIDIDFEHERREEVIQYVYEKYGRERAGIAAEVICYRGRSAVRDVGRAMGLSFDQVDGLAKALDHYDTAAIQESHLAEAGLSSRNVTVRKVIDFVSRIHDFPRHLSQHVGGFVISRAPLCELVPIENAAMEGRTVVEWDKDDLDALGFVKVDLLALGILTATRKCFDLVSKYYDTDLTLATIPAENPETYEMLCHADAVGVFQVESRAQRAMLPRLQPRRFYDLVIEIAIVRPGPIQGGMVHPYLRRRAGEEPYDTNEFPGLRSILERTYGVPLFQEQVMRIAVVGAGFSPGEADRLRRAMGAWKKRGVLEKFYHKFIDGMLVNQYPREFAERVFDQIRGFGEYGFPESHAASFALIAYATSYLKRFYPAAFTAALLNSQPMGFYAPAQLVRDAREHGVEVRAIDINSSNYDCSLENIMNQRSCHAQGNARPEQWGEHGPALRLGFRLIDNLERAAAERIVSSRDLGGCYKSVDDCALRAQLNKKAVEALVAADAFGSMGIARRQAMWQALGVTKKPPLFESMELNTTIPELPPIHESEQVARDYESTGLSLRRHPMAFVRPELEGMGVRPAYDLLTFSVGTEITVAGIVVTRQRPETASGIVFISIEDETGSAQLIVFPKIFDRDRVAARSSTAIIALGSLERQGEVVHLKVIKLWPLEELQQLNSTSRDFH
ncbi:MAG: error-prone DNA polymerase [Planctomycetes bacterium]|nr:error-prone DNA polymerase [Planctomycetota bacterium]